MVRGEVVCFEYLLSSASGMNKESKSLLIDKLLELTGKNTGYRYLPAIEGELEHSVLRPTRFSYEGWSSKISLDEGLKKTVDYYFGDI